MDQSKPQIAVIGSVNTEFLIKVNSLPCPGETKWGNNLEILPGGKAARIAIALARLKARVFFISCVGSDSYGNRIITQLIKEKINVDFVHRSQNQATGIMHTIVDSKGNYVSAISSGSNMHIDKEVLLRAKVLISVCDMLILTLDLPVNFIYYAIDFAHYFNIPVLINATPIENFEKKMIQLTEIIVLNKEEGEYLYKRKLNTFEDAIFICSSIIAEGAGMVVLNLGAKGTIAMTERKHFFYSPSLHIKIDDCCGAGDSFLAAFSVMMAYKKDIKTSLTFANASAAITCSKSGGYHSLPTLNEVFSKLSLN